MGLKHGLIITSLYKCNTTLTSFVFLHRCLCRDGWFGPVCALRHNPCDTNRHNCSDGATCVPLETGYECDCPLGRAGKHCEKGNTHFPSPDMEF